MYSITTAEINEDWGYVWDCLVEACHGSDELEAILDKYEKLPEQNHIAVVNCLVNHFFSDASIRLVAMWGFSDTPARDEIYLDLKRQKDQLKPYLEKNLG
jgi:hypothetical protein